MQLTYRHTKLACYVSYITQAIVNNLCPLLFLTFQQEFSVSFTQISLLITLNFAIQITVDLLSARFVDKIGYRTATVAAHVLSTLGLVGLCVLPSLLPPYTGLMTATVLTAIGGGILEVMVSPLIEALPGERKESEMSLLHSFYCWGHVAVVLLSTAFFLVFGTRNWRILPLLWAVIPLMNTLAFLKVPLCTLDESRETMPLKKLLSMPVFWLFMVLMVCSGASEQAVAQWVSLFAEMGLGVSKTMGDLLGVCAFATLMGISRITFSRVKRLSMSASLLFSGILCLISYALIIFSPWPMLSLVGCGLSGFAVGVMWPGTYSVASQRLAGGTAMFALLALGGDVGCCAGPGLVGAISDGVIAKGEALLSALLPGASLSQAALKSGFLAAILFPALLVGGMLLLKRRKETP